MSALWSFAGKGLNSWLLIVIAYCIFVTFPCSQRARNRFNQVVEAKMLKGVFYVEKCAEFKNQIPKKNWLVHKSAMHNGISPGYVISQNSPKVGVPLQVYN